MYYYSPEIQFSALTGLTLTSIEGLNEGSDHVSFTSEDGRRFVLYHQQDCCEQVYIENLDGSAEDLLNSPILFANEESGDLGPLSEYEDSYEWTFYRIGTVKGTVVMRWYGSSNGYYSTSVTFKEDNLVI